MIVKPFTVKKNKFNLGDRVYIPADRDMTGCDFYGKVMGIKFVWGPEKIVVDVWFDGKDSITESIDENRLCLSEPSKEIPAQY